MQTNIGGVCLCCSIFCFVHHCWSFSSLFFSPLCCLFFDLRLLITPFDIFKHFAIVLSVLLRFTASDYPLWYFQTFRHCVVCSSIYGFWLPPLVSSSSPQYKSMSIRLFWQHREVWKFNIAMYMAFSNVFSTRLNILADLSCLSFKLRRLTTPLVSSESSCVSNLRIVCGNTLPTTTWPQMWRNGNASM